MFPVSVHVRFYWFYFTCKSCTWESPQIQALPHCTYVLDKYWHVQFDAGVTWCAPEKKKALTCGQVREFPLGKEVRVLEEGLHCPVIPAGSRLSEPGFARCAALGRVKKESVKKGWDCFHTFSHVSGQREEDWGTAQWLQSVCIQRRTMKTQTQRWNHLSGLSRKWI